MKSFIASTTARKIRFGSGLVALIAAMCTGLVGCGNSDSLPVLQVYSVKGNVLLADGQPLTGGTIYLVKKAGDLPLTPSAAIGPDGSFSVVTGGSGEGAPAGEYKVRVEAPISTPATSESNRLFPARYDDEDSSGLLVTVRAEPTQLDPITLK